MVYNATDGDQLCLDFGGQFMLPTTAVGAYEFTGDTVRFPDAAGTVSIEDVLGDLGRVELDFDGAIRYRAAECPLSMMFVISRQRRSRLGSPDRLIVDI